MPIKWDPTKDLFMMMQLYSGNSISKEQCQEIINAWPEKLGEKPTVRAIQEHMGKLKTQLNNEIGPSTKSVSKSGAETPVTPKSGKKKAAAPKTPASKRKRIAMSEEDATDDEIATPAIKKEKGAGEDEPVPRLSLARATKGVNKETDRGAELGADMESVKEESLDADGSVYDEILAQIEDGEDEYQPDV